MKAIVVLYTSGHLLAIKNKQFEKRTLHITESKDDSNGTCINLNPDIESGGLGVWDLRMSRRKVSVLMGSSGSIRAMSLAPSGEVDII